MITSAIYAVKKTALFKLAGSNGKYLLAGHGKIKT